MLADVRAEFPNRIIPSMNTRRIGFVLPPPDAFPSGGDLYNQRILQRARSRGFPLRAVSWGDRDLLAGTWDLLVWDSLLLDHVRRLADERVALLLHYLPSLEPALDAGRRAALRAMEHRALAQADRVIATGQPVADAAIASMPSVPVSMCPPGVADAFLRQRPNAPWGPAQARPAPRLLTVAHLLPAKGHADLLDTLGQLRELAWHWHVVGDGGRSPGLEQQLRERAARAGVAARITWHGALGQEAVAALMADSDVFVFPSTWEAYGTVLAEAAAMGLPILANHVGAAGQLVHDGATGYLVNVGDRDGFARRLRELLVDAGLRASFRTRVRALPVRGWGDAFADFRAACEKN